MAVSRSMPLVVKVRLRDVTEGDLPIFFAHQQDPDANRMAAFPARDWEAFRAHWDRLRADPANVVQTILADEQVAGNVGRWEAESQRLVRSLNWKSWGGQGSGHAAR